MYTITKEENQMFKKIRWALLAFIIGGILIITYIVTLVRYAESENRAFNNYTKSLLAMSDVNEVNSIHRFNGLKSYIVANIVHTNGEDVYFFIRDGIIQHFFFTENLIALDDANNVAQQMNPNARIVNTQLGMLDEKPIFEVKLEEKNITTYIVLDAKNGRVLMNFSLE